MPVLRREAASLEELSERKACEDLDNVCRKLQALSVFGSTSQHVLEYAKRVLRPYYVNSLPGAIRSRIIAKTSGSLYGRGANGSSALFSGPTPLYLLTILLGSDVKILKMNLCCYYGCSHQADLLKLLAAEGSGIESLELARSALLRLDCKLLRGALHSMSNLRSLTMRNIASDSILEVIGRSCPRLALLDVACSQQVTDFGLQQLLVRVQVKARFGDSEKTCEDSVPDRRGKSRRGSATWSRIRTFMSKLRVKGEKRAERKEFLLDICQTRNLIGDSLRFLNVAKTNVTSEGVLFVLENAPNVESFGEYSHVSRAIEARLGNESKPRYGLRHVRDTGTTSSRLECLARSCVNLERLWITEPRHSALSLDAFRSLTILNLDSMPPDVDWINDFHVYLNNAGEKLRELSLSFARDRRAPRIDLRKIFLRCRNLVTLTNEGSCVEWSDGDDPATGLSRLERVQVGETVSARAIVKILTLAPELASVHVHSCNELTDKHLEILDGRDPEKSFADSSRVGGNRPEDGLVKNLTCFYVDEASKVSATGVISIFKHCTKLRHIGNLVNWGLNCEDMELVRNFVAKESMDVEICSVAHSFWNTCSRN